MMPPPAAGLALLWPQNDVVIGHAGRDVAVGAGDIAVVDRALPLTVRGNDGWSAQLLDLGSRSFLLRIEQARRRLPWPIDGTLTVVRLVKQLWGVALDIDRLGLDDELVVTRLTDVIAGLGGTLVNSGVDGGLSSLRAKTLERAELLITAMLSDPALSPAALAARMHVSPRHLSSLFAARGTTTTAAILAQRLGRARLLLADPTNRGRQIAEIAAACGFADQGYFTRCFRKDSGLTPVAYRRSTISTDFRTQRIVF